MADAGQFAVYPSLRGRVVVVTGGATGIGAAMVEAFAANAARVAFLDVQAEAAERLREAGAGRQGLAVPVFVPCNLTEIEALRMALAKVGEELGPVEVLVNNAGNDTRHAVEDVTPESWDRTLALNLKHQFFAAQAVIPGMRRLGRGSIINMSSIAWVIPSTNVPVYVTAKAGIVGMTRTLAHEVGKDNIRVNCILPGAIATERQKRLWLTPEYEAEILAAQALKRLIEPEEVARLALFLAADDSAAITNQSHIIDGGWV
ncbi:MAG TPA: SDR family NAD(P)-dependent oxidoreductase [Acidobacteriaceae bacterium]|nr:SDR family NAD(P)-dependent oxidoreductase [Acidobacteriaceae bacterium]